jgi:8-oxo-dGTP diphosphatase
MPKFVAVVECAIEYQGKYLMIRRPEGVHAGNLLAMPGGMVEFSDGENEANILEHAVRREVFEEVGIQLIDPLLFVTSSYFIDSKHAQVLDVIFYCKLEKSNPQVTPHAREVPEYHWMTTEEILAHDRSPVWLKRYIRCADSL